MQTQTLIDEYARGYDLLREAVNGLTEEELRFKPAPDRWSIHEILIHVTDSEVSSTSRMRKVLAEDEPMLASFDQEAWTARLRYGLMDREEQLELFRLLRSGMKTLMEQLTPEEWRRVGVYPDQARFTFEELLGYRVRHVRGHLDQIERVRDAYRQTRGT
ncbi:DinB superfamily protein [Paenibacillus sp. UNC496MF]|uniref:DinB family protein n=1 Tax=Paenibacillus sp. UNC496MF TaxID=1502753 RepID=UPI0008EC06BF|nr:DinB family protein [Paenibacillus sp. UNC496MF]SFJ80024.1 DinB superfamily protein [Paenibacillus sp. UNC496MF]